MYTTYKDDGWEWQRKCLRSSDLKSMKNNDDVSGMVSSKKISLGEKGNNYLLPKMVKDHMAIIKLKNGVKSKCVEEPYANFICYCEDFPCMNNKESLIICKNNNDLLAPRNMLSSISKRKFSKFTSLSVYFQTSCNSVFCKFGRKPKWSEVMKKSL